MKKVLFVFMRNSSFVRFDREILEDGYEVVDFHFPLRKPETDKLSVPWILSRRKALKAAMQDVDAVFSWFGDMPAAYATRYARQQGKRSIVVAGGYGAAYIPGTKYGLQQRWFRRRYAKYAFENADLVLSVSKGIHRDLNRFAKPRKEVVVYNGVVTDNFKPGEKERKVLTVGDVSPVSNWRKGNETFVRAAAHLPDVPFYLVGKASRGADVPLREIATDNVTLTGFISEEELHHHFETSQVYVQPSIYEGFGVSVAEAMLCNCVPVVTRNGALPEVVGDTGFYVPAEDPKATAKAIERALGSDKGPKARQHVLDNFSMDRRHDAILREVAEVV